MNSSIPATPLAGHVALVTGGSRGIGAATGERLAALGAHVVLTYRTSAAAAQQIVAGIEEGGGSAECEPLDVADPGSIRSCVDAVRARHAGIDILVANANAPFRRAPLAQLTADEIAEPVAANLRAAHLLTMSVVESMHARGWGRLVYVGSRHSQGPSAPGMAANGTAKAALLAYLRHVVDEFTGSGVTAHIVSPGMVDTDASRGIGLPEGVLRLLTAATPTGRIATPDDVAEVIALLVTVGEMCNGVDFPITGGLNNPLPIARLLPLVSSS